LTSSANTAHYTSCLQIYRVNIELQYFGHKDYLKHTVAYHRDFPPSAVDGYLPGTPYLTSSANTAHWTSCC